MKLSAPLSSGLFAALLAPLVLAAPGAAQSSTVAIRRGDPVPGVGTVTGLNAFAVNDNGEWLAWVGTNNPDPDSDEVVLRNGFLTLREGTVVGNPPGASIDEFNGVTIDSNGNAAWVFDLNDPNAADGTTEGVYRNTRAIALEGQLLNTPGYARTAKWFVFNGIVKFNDRNQILVGSEVDDPDTAGFTDQSIILLDLDSQGRIISSTDIVHEGKMLPGFTFTAPANGFPYNNKAFIQLNNRGDVLWQSRLDGANNSEDRAVFLNDKAILREGDPSPIPGRTWTSFANVRLGLNDRGDWAVYGFMSGPNFNDELVTLNGKVGVQEREPIPALPGQVIQSFVTNTPILLSNQRDIILRADFTGQAATDSGVLVNYELIAQEGVTLLDGVPIGQFLDDDDALAISPSGRYVMYLVTLASGGQVVGMIDLGTVTPIDDCSNTTVGTLRRLRGFPVLGTTMTLALGMGQGVGVTPFLFLSDRPIFTYPPCGLMTSFGELVIDFGANGNPFLTLIGSPYPGSEVPINIPIANNPTLVDQIFYAQGMFVNIGGVVPGVPLLELTNAVQIQVGGP